MNTDFSLLQKLETVAETFENATVVAETFITFVGKCNSQLKLIRMKTYVDKIVAFSKFRETFCNKKFLQQQVSATKFRFILGNLLYIWTSKTG